MESHGKFLASPFEEVFHFGFVVLPKNLLIVEILADFPDHGSHHLHQMLVTLLSLLLFILDLPLEILQFLDSSLI